MRLVTRRRSAASHQASAAGRILQMTIKQHTMTPVALGTQIRQWPLSASTASQRFARPQREQRPWDGNQESAVAVGSNKASSSAAGKNRQPSSTGCLKRTEWMFLCHPLRKQVADEARNCTAMVGRPGPVVASQRRLANELSTIARAGARGHLCQ